ncbi:hypothetical protein Leryth_027271 [Lithospermum erythrorhizon]|nr:hypothetical protein Leryth_027271 [Lithospermum erythrorhizon]
MRINLAIKGRSCQSAFGSIVDVLRKGYARSVVGALGVLLLMEERGYKQSRNEERVEVESPQDY